MPCLVESDSFSFTEKLYNIKTVGYEIHPLLLDLLQSKTFGGNQAFDDSYFHLDYFENLCSIFALPEFQPE